MTRQILCSGEVYQLVDAGVVLIYISDVERAKKPFSCSVTCISSSAICLFPPEWWSSSFLLLQQA